MLFIAKRRRFIIRRRAKLVLSSLSVCVAIFFVVTLRQTMRLDDKLNGKARETIIVHLWVVKAYHQYEVELTRFVLLMPKTGQL